MNAAFERSGVTLAYDDIPAAGGPGRRATVLVHGFASNRREAWRRTGWYGAVERRGGRLIALDLRGHGQSSKPHDPALYGRAALAEDLLALIEALDVRDVDLVGYSMGAQVALEAALTAPERIANLVLGGVGARLLQRGSGSLAMAEAMESDDPAAIVQPMLRGFRQFADEQGEDRLALAAFVRAEVQHIEPARLAALPVATLVVAGARDQLAGDPQVLADTIPGARAVVLPGCDHFSAIPHALFKASVFDWLDGWLE